MRFNRLRWETSWTTTPSGSRLGVRLCCPHACRCGSNVDEYGQHGMYCRCSGGRYSPHSALSESLKRALTSTQTPAIREPSGNFRNNEKRPDGMI
ncbi:hypothetical protein RvY_10738 [Ramazzottius varieornatus]|uniref:Uncharacterized protein n=1 Tax=Ramazzottius varieornatus TaxID=947166 RepID=A0A1D1VJ50_RAMVA|nr:hypothetical protein RvY_10738 [Ramazzottius varieornatus]